MSVISSFIKTGWKKSATKSSQAMKRKTTKTSDNLLHKSYSHTTENDSWDCIDKMTKLFPKKW